MAVEGSKSSIMSSFLHMVCHAFIVCLVFFSTHYDCFPNSLGLYSVVRCLVGWLCSVCPLVPLTFLNIFTP